MIYVWKIELMIGDNRHFLFVNIMTTTELYSLKDADGAISKQAHIDLD